MKINKFKSGQRRWRHSLGELGIRRISAHQSLWRRALSQSGHQTIDQVWVATNSLVDTLLFCVNYVDSLLES